MKFLNWLGKRLISASDDRGPLDDVWYRDTSSAMGTAAGVAVTADLAERIPAMRTCLGVLSRPIGSLPLKIFRRRPDGGKGEAHDHPLQAVLAAEPNDEEDAFQFRSQMQWDLGLWNNAYAQILPGPRGAIDQLVRLHPSLVTPKRLRDRRVVYEARDELSGRTRTLAAADVWHLKMVPYRRDGLAGKPQFQELREVLARAWAVHDFGARFFNNDGTPPFVLKHPGTFHDDEDRKRFKKAWQEAQGGKNRHSTAVLEFGMEPMKIGIDNEAAQFNSTEKECDLKIARGMHVPPHKIGILDRATFSNIEQQALEFVTDTLLPWIVLWEQGISRNLLSAWNDPSLFAEFNVAGLLRGDLKARYDAYFKGRQGGWLSVNDIRQLENMNPIDGGEDHLRPLNMVPLDAPPREDAGEIDEPGAANAVRGNGHDKTGGPDNGEADSR